MEIEILVNGILRQVLLGANAAINKNDFYSESQNNRRMY